MYDDNIVFFHPSLLIVAAAVVVVVVVPMIISSSSIIIYDIIMINWSLCRTLIPIVKRHNIPIIVDDRSPPVHENLFGKMQWLHYHYSWKYASKNGDGFSFNSLELQKMVTEKYSLDKSTCVYPSATYPEMYTKSNLDKGEQVVLVYHGLLDKERSVYEIFKASDEMVDALTQLIAKQRKKNAD